ncbi:MAG: 16S rRNA (cytosine(1402)-N(4))-methyltransferase [Candidatus Omnitrophica bacterium CG12_big_fil_rev_8_21_14_0_65_50_5]|nr:MAG: 16S rRNA (cytosine(1402)-N(4))-methyltransferase [Candidatus Omnitrophica bacterium CG12_big_fil_rev_8_21_14_0_65_50_5]
MDDKRHHHDPVLLQDVMHYLDPKPGETVVDGTIGLGGHAAAILRAMQGRGRLIGFDQDEEALATAKQNLRDFSGQLTLLHDNVRNIDCHFAGLSVGSFDKLVLDLGVSSLQLDCVERGFSFQSEAPLDMRMNRTRDLTARRIVNEWDQEDLEKLIRECGEERWSRRIARRIVEERGRKPIETTAELAKIVVKCYLPSKAAWRIHPATRTFQALRITVNQELESLAEVLEKAWKLLNPDGRIVVISFHSLEDRIVKQRFRRWKDEGAAELLVKKPLIATDEETEKNPRARSAKLRAIRKIK